MLGVDQLGCIEYANQACADLLGYADGATMNQLHLPKMLVGHEALEPVDCLATLKTPPPIVVWSHREDHVVRTIVSAPMMLRSSDTLLMVGITDITEWLWENSRNSAATGRINHSP